MPIRYLVSFLIGFLPFATEAADAQATEVPRGRQAAVMAFDARTNRLIVYGGMLSDARTYAWSAGGWRVLTDSGPAPRDEVAVGYDPGAGAVLAYGGRGDGQTVESRPLFRELWRFDGIRWSLLDTSGPPARVALHGAFDPRRGRFVVFGGSEGRQGGPLPSDTWEWDGKRWHRFVVDAPPGRFGHSMAYDQGSGLVVLHGGLHADVRLSDTWGWDGTRWRLLAMDGPPIRFGAAATAPDSGIVVFGRVGQDKPSATWLWRGNKWTPIASEGPRGRIFPTLTYDATHRRIFMIGGGSYDGVGPNSKYVVHNDLWILDDRFVWSAVATP